MPGDAAPHGGGSAGAGGGARSAGNGGSGGSAGSGGTGGSGGSAGSVGVWGCGDNGTDCLCYDPPPTGYTQASCGSYSCCWAARYNGVSGGVEHECECSNAEPCTRENAKPEPAGPSATRVSHCP